MYTLEVALFSTLLCKSGGLRLWNMPSSSFLLFSRQNDVAEVLIMNESSEIRKNDDDEEHMSYVRTYVLRTVF